MRLRLQVLWIAVGIAIALSSCGGKQDAHTNAIGGTSEQTELGTTNQGERANPNTKDSQTPVISEETKKFAPPGAVFEFNGGKRLGKVDVDVPKDNPQTKSEPTIVNPVQPNIQPTGRLVPSNARPDPVRNRRHRGRDTSPKTK